MSHLLILNAKLDFLLKGQSLIIRLLEAEMSALDDLTAQISKNTDLIESATQLIVGLKAELDAAGTDPVKLAALSAALGSEDAKLAAAIVANTPAGGLPTPAPAPTGTTTAAAPDAPKI